MVSGLCLLPTLLPGDVPWINDEPELILNALRLNQSHSLAQIGIQGSKGLHYGPLPIWLYQGFLAFSHDLRTLVALRALITMVGCAIGLVWLARGLRVTPWLVPITLASPYLWLYSRALWDNTFLIPLAALSVGAYVAFLDDRRTGLLLCALTSALLMTLIHPMSLAVVLPMALHAAIVARAEIWRSRYVILAILVTWSIVSHDYFSWWIANRSSAKLEPSLVAGTFPFIGGRWLSAVGLDEFFQDSWRDIVGGTIWLDFARILTVLMLPAVWVGMALAGIRLRSGTGERHPALVVLLMIVAAQMALAGSTGAAGPSHYFNATWPVFAALAWLSLDRLLAYRWTRWLPAMLGVSLIVVVASIILRVHRLGGTRGSGYGPTLSNQMMIARELNHYPSDTPVRTDVTNFSRFPHGLRVLRLLDDRPLARFQPTGPLLIRYVGGRASGRVALTHP